MRRSPFGARFGQFGDESPLFIKQFLRFVALHPALQQLDVIGMLGIHEKRHLVRSERALDFQTVDEFRPRPALR